MVIFILREVGPCGDDACAGEDRSQCQTEETNIDLDFGRAFQIYQL
jgi:hypothetical protein